MSLSLSCRMGVSDSPHSSGIVKKNPNANCMNGAEVLCYSRMFLGCSTNGQSFFCLPVEFQGGVCFCHIQPFWPHGWPSGSIRHAAQSSPWLGWAERCSLLNAHFLSCRSAQVLENRSCKQQQTPACLLWQQPELPSTLLLCPTSQASL